MLMMLVYLLIALGFSFLCSVLEAVILSVTPAYVASRSGSGSRSGRQLAALKRDIDRPLAAILTLNTFAHTIGAAGVGAEAQKLWGEESLSVVSAVVTILILIGSEIIPKTLGAVYWERLVRPAMVTTQILTLLLLPLVWLSMLLTRLLRRDHRGSVLSRADISNVVDVGYRDGILRRNERIIISNLINFQAITVADIMTPRPAIVALDQSARIRDLGPGRAAWFVSRIPVYQGDLDHISGYVLKDEILAAQLAGKHDDPLSSLTRNVVRVRQDLPMPELYAILAEASEHIAIVTDAAGATVGVVTLEDLIETMLGLEIEDEADVSLDLKARARARASRERRSRHSAQMRRVESEPGSVSEDQRPPSGPGER